MDPDLQGIMPFAVAVVAIVMVTITIMVISFNYLEHRTKMEMLKRGFVPRGYQPINQPQPVSQPQMQPNMQPTYPRYELPELPTQTGTPMPFGDQPKPQAANLYDMPTTTINAGKRN